MSEFDRDSLTTGFPPLLGRRPRVLVLGTLPSQKSLQKQQYYGHPQNAFWPIMGSLFGAGPDLPYAERVAVVTRARVAVWDVLGSSVRPGSMDADIDIGSATPNDFTALLSSNPDIELVCFNGQAAARLFLRLVAPSLETRSNTPDYRTLPSTSPAYASMSFTDKLDRWRIVRTVANRE